MITSPLLNHLQGYIDGHWVDSVEGDIFPVINPATGACIAEVAALSAEDVGAAVSAGQRALALHPSYSIETRRSWLEGIRDALLENRDEIGRILCQEHGKPLQEACGEVDYAAGFFDYCARHCHLLAARQIEEEPKDCTWTVHYRPIGVVGLITPWNFPIAMIAKKLSAALAAGCPSIIKPASATPLTMIALFSLLDEKLDLPKGMVNLVMGKASIIGDALCQHPDVPMLSFTGSTEVGRRLIAATARSVKKLALELGGNAPFIVFADADLNAAVDNLMANKFRGGGQTCVCANRVFVHDSIVEQFETALTERVSALRVGNGMDDGVDLGPLIDRDAFDKVRRHVSDALEKGARLVAGPDPSRLGDDDLFYPPSIVSGVTDKMACWNEETFGPLIGITTFQAEEDVIRAANATESGLAGYVFTEDTRRAERVIAALRFGHVGWNTAAGPTPEAPFGGMKASGLGREGGLDGLFEFVEAQTIPRPK